MTGVEVASPCSTDVLVNFGESLHVYAGLLTVATVCGGLAGVLAAAVLYMFCVKPLLITKQGYSARRLLEPDVGQADNPSDRGRREAPNAAITEKKKQQHVSTDVTAFASRAKVVYPINQKYRPLADGASNPSLHENSKLPPMPDEESSSSIDEESLSQEQDNDSSHYISSSLVPKSLQNQTFTIVSHYPHTLIQAGFEGRICLYYLALRNLQEFSSQLEEDKYEVFLQILRKILGSRSPKEQGDTNDAKNILKLKEKEINELKKQSSNSEVVSGKSPEGFCSLEEIERIQKDLLEHGLERSRQFSKLVENLCQFILKSPSIFPLNEAQHVNHSTIQTLLFVETHQMKAQEAEIRRIQEKLFWWEELAGFVQSQPALQRWEMSLKHGVIAETLEQLTSDGILEFKQMEKILSEIQAALTECLKQCNEECAKKTDELVNDKCCKKEAKKKKMQRSQIKQRSRVVETELPQDHDAQDHDPQNLSQIYLDLRLKQREQICDLELQQDHKIAEALSDLWKNLRVCWSNKLTVAARNIFLTSLTTQASLTTDHCEKLWFHVERELDRHLEKAECTIKRHLLDIRSELHKEEQLWNEGTALVQACLKHLGEEQMKILRHVLVGQSYTLDSKMGALIEKKHECHLMVIQRHFTVRHACLHILKEMRLSKLRALSLTDFRILLEDNPNMGWPCISSALKSSTASLAGRNLGPEKQLLDNNHQQEFLSELETAAELLQSHAHLVLGNALGHTILKRMANLPKQEDSGKNHLVEAAVESVYLTKDSLTTLVQSYYSHLKGITSRLQEQLNRDSGESQDSSCQLSRVLLRELENWGKKPASAEFQQRVEQYKRKMLEQSDLNHQLKYDKIRKRRNVQDQGLKIMKRQLKEAEDDFVTQLTALARVSNPALHVEHSQEEDNNDVLSNPAVMDLLALNPALDPALNPSLTPTYTTLAVRPKPKKKGERERQLS